MATRAKPGASHCKFRCGQITVVDTGQIQFVASGQTSGRVECSGQYRIFEASDGVETRVELAYANWANGERDVRALEVAGPLPVRRLEKGGLRLGIRGANEGTLAVELRQARVKLGSMNLWSNLFKANLRELNEGCGLNAELVLRQAGAVAIGTKEELLGSEDNTRGNLCAFFPSSNLIFPVVVFVLTRVMPLQRIYPAR